MSDATVVKLLQPGSFADPLTEVLRNGARALLAQAIEVEVAEFLAKHADQGFHTVCKDYATSSSARANDPLRFGMRFLDCLKHPFRISWLSHGVRLFVDPVLYERNVRRNSSRSWITLAVFCSLRSASSKVICSRNSAS